MGVVCLVCNKIFSKQSNLNRHHREVHGLEANPVSYDKSVWNYKCLESNCNNSYQKSENLIHHLRAVHNMSFGKTEEIIFTNKNEFESWKTNYEMKNKCNYVVARTRKRAEGESIYYNCNRTKTGKQCSQQRQRLLKSQGSCKLNFACTSQLKLTNDGNKLYVHFQRTHYGHDFDLQHLRISKDDKAIIASKLIAGVTKTRIVDSVRDKIEEVLKRIDLLTFKDVDNIKHSYNIETRDGKRHNNDAISLDLWVQECKTISPEENPVIFYKRQGEASDVLGKNDFCLVVMNKFQQMMFTKFGFNVISIDGTHGLNSYEFELTTIMVIDEFGQGFPVAFMFSNKKDTYIYELFFKSIRQKLGSITAKTFMSDITNTFYTAWLRVMGPVTYRLFCAWHVDRAWQTNLPKINDKDKRAEVYKTLKVLQEELNEDNFRMKLVSAINLMLEDKDTHNFGQYFEANYMNNCEQWAYCYRKSTGINTNMRLESMHKTIKYFYLNRKKINRLDKGLHTVLKYVRDKSVERVIKLVKGKNTIYHQQIFKRHQFAMKSKFTIQMTDEVSWEVKSELETYLFKRLLNSKCCRLVCPECRICMHMYSCSCEDFTYNNNICKHIHYTKMSEVHLKSKQRTDLLSENTSGDSNNFIITLGSQTENKDLTKIVNKVNQTFVKLQNSNLNDLDDSTILEMHMHLNILNNLVDLPKSSTNTYFKSNGTNESFNKNIDHQLRFCSTQKRKRKCHNNNKKPTKKQKVSINNILSGKSEEYISENSKYDHTYL